MSDWQPGDHAVCVEDCTFRDPRCTFSADVPDIYFHLGPRRGQRFVVTGVEVRELPENYETQIEVYLKFRETPEDKCYLARAFRKIDPIDAEEHDSGRIAEMASQPEQVPA